ncbi:hypothetical protein OAS18_05885 [Nitrospinaceae bacterium]|nr:hypothetical protein [Nitrospinaceae bacterium]
MYSEVKMFRTLVLSDESLKIFLTKMIRWNKTRKKFLIMSSAVWIILTLGGSIHIYPEKRNDRKFEKKEIIDLFKKEDKTHEENIVVLEILRKENSLDFDSNEIKALTEKSIASLSYSIIQHQRIYNEKKKRAIELFFLGCAMLVGFWGVVYFLSVKRY